jgi:preprotein translocase subunit SecE
MADRVNQPKLKTGGSGPVTPDDKKKKKRAAVQANAKKRRKGALKEYFKGVRLETKKVVWPTRKEMVSYTIVVLVACVFFSLVIWGIDSGFLALLKQMLNITL